MTTVKASDDKQVGGTHYKTAYQHWNLLPALGFGPEYFVGQAVKYLSRWRKKNGVRDILKAQHFIEKLAELVEERGSAFLPCDLRDEIAHKSRIDTDYKQHLFQFFSTNDVDNDTAAVCIAVMYANSKGVLVEAAEHCGELANAARIEEAEAGGFTEVEKPVSLQFEFIEYTDGGTGIEWKCNRCGEHLKLGMAEPPSSAHRFCEHSQKAEG